MDVGVPNDVKIKAFSLGLEILNTEIGYYAKDPLGKMYEYNIYLETFVPMNENSELTIQLKKEK